MDSGRRNSQYFFKFQRTFSCAGCSSLAGLAPTCSPDTKRGCNLIPPPLISGIQVICRNRLNTPLSMEKELCFEIVQTEASRSSHVGALHINIINMEDIRTTNMKRFWKDLCGHHGSMLTAENLALVFDNDGNIINGSCWTTQDFQDTTSVIIEDLDVVDEWKGRIEPRLLQRIFCLEDAKDVEVILVQILEQKLGEIGWLCDVGFCRVAYSEFFGLAKNPEYPSHAVKAHKDNSFKTQPIPIPGWATYRTSQNFTM
ncbi:hypothetical protein B0H19DRAFT_1095853 [Mycena capillaripes]|nr:hypothetical protein B0H19DRAFT_1095853 [Mycena capillaripes]